MGLWEKHNYLNKEITHLINIPIREYDMKSAGYSILKKNGIFTKEEEKQLEKSKKIDRNVYIGNLLRTDKNLSKVLMDGFKDARRLFLTLNSIKDENLLSAKKDALFIINTPVKNLKFEGYEFELKNTFSSYYRLNEKEFYYRGKEHSVDIKGLGGSILLDHEEYFLKDLMAFFRLAEITKRDTLLKYLKKYRSEYLRRQLPIETYREMNMENKYRTRLNVSHGGVFFDNILVDDPDLDIGYNYIRYIIPLVKCFL